MQQRQDFVSIAFQSELLTRAGLPHFAKVCRDEQILRVGIPSIKDILQIMEDCRALIDFASSLECRAIAFHSLDRVAPFFADVSAWQGILAMREAQKDG